MIDRSYTLPVIAAAVLHLGAFLLVREGPAPRHVLAPIDRIVEVPLPPFETPPEPVEADPFDSQPAHAAQAAPIEIADSPQPYDAGRFQVDVVPVNPNVDLHATIPVLSAGPAGPGLDGGLSHVRVIDSRLLDHEPKTRYQRPPLYPTEARQQGIGGRVIVEFIVDEAGRVTNARVVHSTDARFDAPTLQAVSAWRFEPCRRSGQPVRFRMQVPVEFNLNDG